ncbi:desulfoferrodoxin [Patescibacteria group bacterium]|nr:desulfoferrodoxin [Patescibacteria group bacterium]
MTKQNQIYKCEVCGNIVDILHTGAGELVCCDQPMKLENKQTEDQGQEKHLPVVEESVSNACSGNNGTIIKVGEIEHPMEESHYIEWIQVTTIDNKRVKKFFKPGDNPEMNFCNIKKIVNITAYCNVHGLWGIEVN